MTKETRQPSYILPHNPITAAGVMEELKRLKGDKPWLELELELFTAQYPDNATFKAALEQYRAKAATTPPSTATTEQATPDKVTPATDATTGKATKKAAKKATGTKGQGNGK